MTVQSVMTEMASASLLTIFWRAKLHFTSHSQDFFLRVQYLLSRTWKAPYTAMTSNGNTPGSGDLNQAEQGLLTTGGGALKAVSVPLPKGTKSCDSGCGHDHGVEMKVMKIEGPSIEELLNSSVEDLVKSISTLLRFGRFEALGPLMEQLIEKKSDQIPAILSQMDEGGHSVLVCICCHSNWIFWTVCAHRISFSASTGLPSALTICDFCRV